MTSPPQESIRSLATRKAACVRHYGPDDERTLIAAAELRTALLASEIVKAAQTSPPISEQERRELIRLLLRA